MRRFQPIPNVRLTCATSEQQAEKIVSFINTNQASLGVTVHIENKCVVCADLIKESRIKYILGVVAGFLLSNK